MTGIPAGVRRALRNKQVQQKIGLSASSIKNRLNPRHPQYDSTLPKPFKLGDLPNSPNAWDEAELDEWLARRMEMRDAKRQPAEAPA